MKPPFLVVAIFAILIDESVPLFISDDSVFSIKNRLIECDSALDCFNKLILARPNIR